jgi:hypothetical protein
MPLRPSRGWAFEARAPGAEFHAHARGREFDTGFQIRARSGRSTGCVSAQADSPRQPIDPHRETNSMGATRKKTTKSPKSTLHDDEDPKKATATKPDEMPADVIEFIQAIDTYKRVNQRPFPNWSEVLEIVKALGYNRSA